MEYKKRMSIKVSLFIYLFVALVFSISVYLIVYNIADKIRHKIFLEYIDDISGYYEMFNEYYERFGDGIPIPQIPSAAMRSNDASLIAVCDFVQTWGALILISFSMFEILTVFYKKRIKAPFDLLEQGAAKIANQELDFSISYKKNDELGHLCAAFEKMRKQLYINNSATWEMFDEQKQMRAAFSHDLRTPMSVLKGYVEYLVRYYPQGRLSDAKIMETLQDLTEQINRIVEFADTMKEINHLDDIYINKNKIRVSVVHKKTEIILKVLSSKYQKKYSLCTSFVLDELWLDIDIYLEVLENIIANAMRFSRDKVWVELNGDETEISAMIYDDGPGFEKEEIVKVSKPYYHGKNDEEVHYGMGLFICKVLCEKHEGYLTFKNLSSGGACVIVKLSILF